MDVLKQLADRLFEQRPEEDGVDRANNSVTPFLLLCCAIVVFAKEYGPVSEPMYCWTQAEFNEQWMEYIHDYCFVDSTYYVPFNESVPTAAGQRNRGTDRLNYYQWVPFILVAMALFSQSTHYFWCFCNMLSVQLCAPNQFFRTLFARNCLALVYLCTKFLYLVANIIQFKFISIFLGVNKLPSWGWTVLNNFLTHGTSWEHNGHFPRVTLCDLKIRQPDEHFQNFTVQCVLVANFLNEKIFMMLYFWFILMAFVSLISLVQWCWTLLFRPQNRFVTRLIELSILQIFPDPEFNDELILVMNDNSNSNNNNDVEKNGTAAVGGARGLGMDGGGVDGLDDRPPQHGNSHCSTGPANMMNTKAVNDDDDIHSGAASNNSTATMEEMAQHGREIVRSTAAAAEEQHRHGTGIQKKGTTTGNDGICDATIVAADHITPNCCSQSPPPPHHHQPLHAANSSTNSSADGDTGEGRDGCCRGVPPAGSSKWGEQEEATALLLLVEMQKKRNAFYRDFINNKEQFMDFLGVDGIMAAKMMCASAGLQMTSLVMGRLFDAFLQHNNFQREQQRNAIHLHGFTPSV